MDFFMKASVYLLISYKDRKTYLGSTDNLERRLIEHSAGKCKATKWRRPLRLIYREEFDSLLNARKREIFLKTRKGRQELKIIFQNIGE